MNIVECVDGVTLHMYIYVHGIFT